MNNGQYLVCGGVSTDQGQIPFDSEHGLLFEVLNAVLPTQLPSGTYAVSHHPFDSAGYYTVHPPYPMFYGIPQDIVVSLNMSQDGLAYMCLTAGGKIRQPTRALFEVESPKYERRVVVSNNRAIHVYTELSLHGQWLAAILHTRAPEVNQVARSSFGQPSTSGQPSTFGQASAAGQSGTPGRPSRFGQPSTSGQSSSSESEDSSQGDSPTSEFGNPGKVVQWPTGHDGDRMDTSVNDMNWIPVNPQVIPPPINPIVVNALKLRSRIAAEKAAATNNASGPSGSKQQRPNRYGTDSYLRYRDRW